MPQAQPDRYELVRRIPTTSSYQSYEASHPRRPGRFVVDVFTEVTAGPDAVQAFQRDVAKVSSLRHPYILQTLELTALPDGTPIVVSELPQGQTLKAWLDAGNSASARVGVRLIVALADALAAAHVQGVPHGALRAEHVFLVGAGSGTPGLPKLKGFGLEWLRQIDCESAASGTETVGAIVVGAEVGGPSASVDGDIAALAILAEQILTLKEPPETEIDRRFFLGDDVLDVLERASGRSSREPFESITHFAAALEAAATGESGPFEPGNQDRTWTVDARRGRPARRSLRMVLGLGLGLASAAAIGAAGAALGPQRLGISPQLWESMGPLASWSLPWSRAGERQTPSVTASKVGSMAGSMASSLACCASPIGEIATVIPAPGPASPTTAGPPMREQTVSVETPDVASGAAIALRDRHARRGVIWSPSLGRVVYVGEELLPSGRARLTPLLALLSLSPPLPVPSSWLRLSLWSSLATAPAQRSVP